jgi:hypothetical protein
MSLDAATRPVPVVLVLLSDRLALLCHDLMEPGQSFV